MNLKKDGVDFKITQTSVVNTDNEFYFGNIKFVIPDNNREYEVFRKSGEEENYENESKMDRVNVVLDKDGLKFYNQILEEINGVVAVK